MTAQRTCGRVTGSSSLLTPVSCRGKDRAPRHDPVLVSTRVCCLVVLQVWFWCFHVFPMFSCVCAAAGLFSSCVWCAKSRWQHRGRVHAQHEGATASLWWCALALCGPDQARWTEMEDAFRAIRCSPAWLWLGFCSKDPGWISIQVARSRRDSASSRSVCACVFVLPMLAKEGKWRGLTGWLLVR